MALIITMIMAAAMMVEMIMKLIVMVINLVLINENNSNFDVGVVCCNGYNNYNKDCV